MTALPALPLPAALADLPAWMWVAGSMLVGIGGSLAVWIGQRRGRSDSGLALFLRTRAGVLVAWLARLVWLIGPGYAALLLGIVSPKLMGLSQIRIDAGLGEAALLAVVALGMLTAATVVYRRGQPAAPVYASRADRVADSVRLAVEAGALQWHWAFYRAVLIAALMRQEVANPVYLGVWLSVALVMAEGLLQPLFWRDLRTPGLAAPRLLRAALLIVSAQIYLLSRNFWLCWAFHAAAAVLLEPRLRTPYPAPPDAETSAVG